MFCGVTHLNLDPKNRLAVPSRYRNDLELKFQNRMVITLESEQMFITLSRAKLVTCT